LANRKDVIMNTISYVARPSYATVETTYQVSDDELTWTAGPVRNSMRLADIRSVRIFASPSMRYRFMGNEPILGFDLFIVKSRDGRTRAVSSKHYQNLAVFEDRGATFVPFVDAVMTRVANVNPTAVFRSGMPSGVWWLWIGVSAIIALCAVFGVLMVISAATGAGTTAGLILGLVFTVGTGASLRSALIVVSQGRQKSFDPRAGMPMS
jgi:hypothetical protein